MEHSTVRVGGSPAQVTVLCEALSAHFRRKNDHEEDVDDEQNLLTITNKYFTAKVKLEPLCRDLASATMMSSADTAADVVVARQEDGIILVYPQTMRDDDDATTTGTTTTAAITRQRRQDAALTAWHQQALASDQCGDLLRLCVAVVVDDDDEQQQETEEEYANRILWCLDRGYEYVERTDLSARGRSTGFEEREKEGFARLVEAVEGTVWSRAVMHRKNQARSSSGGGGVPRNNSSSIAPTRSSTYAPPTLTTTSTDDDRHGSGPDDDDHGKEANIVRSLSVVADETKTATLDDNDHKVDEDKAVFDHLESAMKHASQVRQDAREGKLSDEDRRKRAGDVAMKLMGLLDIMDDDDEEEEDSSDDEA